ncbi:sensor histidine kinase [Wenxinia saemankumensis]|uniref:histidine kinase n=1 Tax=Wenxinia saemankumensis TaxID=1447782 RepID=A0A1M6ER61_9RHOB|nr:histidine kinase dimerization/phosphoacceptor domain -containing protein [Wenxinia saemankumensis]SHI87947.1 Two-component sensor histidine kinase, contains HisKA and HATPase domains [Wenxinia saemankumensis]
MTESPGPFRRFFDRLAVRLSLSIAIALLPLAVIAVWQALAVIREAQGRSELGLMGVTLHTAAIEARLIYEARGIADSLAETVPLIYDESPEACDAALADVVEGRSQFSALAYVDNEGDVLCASDGSRMNVQGLSIFEDAASRDTPGYYANNVAPLSGAAVVGAVSPVFDAEGDRAGFVAISLPRVRAPVLQEGTPQYALERETTLITFGPEGEVLTSSIPLEDVSDTLPQGRTLDQLADQGQQSFNSFSREGQRRAYSVAAIVPGQFYAMGSWPRRVAELDLSQSLSPLLLPALMFVGSMLMAWLAADRLVLRHLRPLGRAMSSFAGGTRVVGRVRSDSAPVEIRDLADSFLAMTDTILRDEAELEDTIRQKEVLLREVHHRVKNNLQLIASIMNLQMRTAHSAEAKRLIRSLQERVMSLATVHKELYHTSGLTEIHADELLSEILQQILRMSSTPGRPVDLETSFAPVQLLPDQAVPVSLFVTEALTNALRYAAKSPSASMRLIVRMDRVPGTDKARIEIANSQPGTDADRSGLDGGTGLGQRLLAAFAAQTGGGYETLNEPDLFRIVLTFTPLAPSKD